MKRIKKTLTLVSMAVLLLTACEAPKELGVVPYPQYAQTTSKTVELPSTVTFSTNLAKSDMNDLLAYLPDFAIPMKLVDKNPFVTIEITDATDNPIAAEGYNLTVSKQGVNIQASSAAGAFYGLQTLAQLARNGKKLPVTTIKDEPRFPYRGLHLDVSRHFFNTDYVKKQIDLVATYKINRLHWHLTDGAGWRLEIPGYPRLTEFAAWRKAANLQDWGKYGQIVHLKVWRYLLKLSIDTSKSHYRVNMNMSLRHNKCYYSLRMNLYNILHLLVNNSDSPMF